MPPLRPRWLIPLALWLIPLLGVGGPLVQLLIALAPRDDYGIAPAPGPAWWACVLASPAVALLIAFATGRTFSFFTGTSVVLLIAFAALWIRSTRSEEAIAYCHKAPSGRTFVGVFSAGGGFAVSWRPRSFWVLMGLMFPGNPSTAPNPALDPTCSACPYVQANVHALGFRCGFAHAASHRPAFGDSHALPHPYALSHASHNPFAAWSALGLAHKSAAPGAATNTQAQPVSLHRLRPRPADSIPAGRYAPLVI